MRIPIKIRVRRDDKVTTEDALLWIDELPPEIRHGKNHRMKSRRGKRQIQEAIRAQDEEQV